MQALVRRGAMVSYVAWDEVLCPAKRSDGPLVAQAVTADAYVLRTTWDYWDRLDRFTEFVNAMAQDQLLNPTKTVLANLHKSYLRELDRCGVAIVPTVFVEAGGEEAALEQVRSRGWSVVVAKPSVGAAGSGLKKFDDAWDDLVEYLRVLTADGMALLQQFLPRVASDGETSLVYFEGEFSHAVTKVPAEGDYRSQVDFGGVYTLVEPTEEQRAAGRQAIGAWEDTYGERPLYARVDLVPGMDGEPLLGELELIEPELFLDMNVNAAGRFADAIVGRARAAASEGQVRQSRTGMVGEAVFAYGGCAVLLVTCAVGATTLVVWVVGLLSGGP